jgi:hypothetical protein
MKKVIKIAAIAAFSLTAALAHAGAVRVWSDQYSPNPISNFYNNLPGHSSQVISGDLNTNNLSGVNLLWAIQPSDPYTAAEISSMQNFLAGGGRIAFMGEHGTFAPNENNRISAAIVALGGHISIINQFPDAGFRTASVGDGQILSHALTTGVNFYEYACFAPLLISGPAQALMLGEENFPNNIMMAYENIGPGSIFLITDQNVWDNVSSGWPSHDNERMFENLLSGNTGAPPPPGNNVPEPGLLALLGIGLAALARNRRRI